MTLPPNGKAVNEKNSLLTDYLRVWHETGMGTPIHPLRRWLFENQLTASEFSKRTGIAEGYLSEIMRGKKRPTLGMIDKISAATRRALSANDFQSLTESTNNDRAP